jgi:hypothetical protein
VKVVRERRKTSQGNSLRCFALRHLFLTRDLSPQFVLLHHHGLPNLGAGLLQNVEPVYRFAFTLRQFGQDRFEALLVWSHK